MTQAFRIFKDLLGFFGIERNIFLVDIFYVELLDYDVEILEMTFRDDHKMVLGDVFFFFFFKYFFLGIVEF